MSKRLTNKIGNGAAVPTNSLVRGKRPIRLITHKGFPALELQAKTDS